MIKEENYSIQAENLMKSLISDFEEIINDFHEDLFYLHEIKKLRFNINNRIRKISDLAEIKNNNEDVYYQIIVFNTEYNELISNELDTLNLSYETKGQLIFVKKKKLTFNQLMTIVDEIEKSKNKILTKCSKAKLEPILRAKNALENEFIEQHVSRETSDRCQKFYEKTEKSISDITEKKIKKLLKNDYERYLLETIK